MTDPVVPNSTRGRLAEEIAAEVTRERGRSLILIGEHGVGKTALIRTALDTADPSWAVFEAGAGQLSAGAMYIGQLEARVEEVVQRLAGKRVIWVFPGFGEALFAGAYRENPTGLIDRLLPHLERGSLRVIAEATPDAYELLLAKRPSLRSALQPLRLRPLDEDETIRLSRDVLAGVGVSVDDDATLREAFDLAHQFLPGVSAPGNVLRLLRATVQRVEEDGRSSLATSDVIATLSLLSGIPLAMLDPTQPLGLDSIREFLEARVIGQKEATGRPRRPRRARQGRSHRPEPAARRLPLRRPDRDRQDRAREGAHRASLRQPVAARAARHERVSDPGQPRAPARRRERRLQRGAADRVRAARPVQRRPPRRVREGGRADPGPLPAAVRRRPADRSLRAHDRFPALRDHHDVECRLRPPERAGRRLRLAPGAVPRRDVDRALRRTFRPEFLNRIDRIVVFQPFERDEIRTLLQKELDEVVLRRGMRDRPWAIEIDESAIAFLIEKGFTPDLGARPLKRAVEQYVLTPLARAIADGQVPTGDQFLFLTAGSDRLEVQFVGLEADPAEDVPDAIADEGAMPIGADAQPGAELRSLLRSQARAPDAVARLDSLLAGVQAVVDGEVSPRKLGLLEEISDDGFWEREERFAVLAEAEYLDRLEAATRTAERLAERLRHADSRPARTEVAMLLANRLYVLDRALAGLRDGAPFDVALRLGVASGSETSPEAADFLEDVCEMYVAWAGERGMKLRAAARHRRPPPVRRRRPRCRGDPPRRGGPARLRARHARGTTSRTSSGSR